MTEKQLHKSESKTARLLPLVILAVVSFGVYFNALFNDFVYDDKEQVIQNSWIRDVRNIPEIFSESVWGFATEVEDQGVANYYRPAMHLVYMGNYYVFGLKPWGFHLVNVLFHAGVSILVFLVAARLQDEESKQYAVSSMQSQKDSLFAVHYSRLFPFVAALLFAAHPIHTEAVTWVASLPEVAFAFFYLLSLYFYIRAHPPLNPLSSREGKQKEAGNRVSPPPPAREGESKGGKWNYPFSLISFAISVFFKEPALTLPALLIAYDYAFRRPPKSPLAKGGFKEGFYFLRGYVPYFVIAGFYFILRMNALKSMVPTETFSGLSFYQAVINIFPLFMEYLKDLLFPFDLKFWHTFHPLETLLNAEGLLSLLTAAAFAAAVIFSWKKSRIVFFSLLFIVVPLLPAFYIKGIGSKPYAERYLYLSSVGFVILAAVLLLWLLHRTPRYGKAATIVLLLLAGAYSVQTIARNPDWKDDFSFFEDTVKKSPDAVPVRIAYGVALSDQGRLAEAIEQYQNAIKFGPNYWQAYENLGIAYGKRGLMDKAIEQIELALKLNPNSAVTRSNLGNAYMRTGSVDKAIEELGAAIKLNPDFFAAHFNLGNAYEQKGMLDKAIEEYRTALRIRPDHDEAHYLLGRAHANSGRLEDAIEHFKAAVRLKPANPSYRNTLGVLYGQKGLIDQALEQFEAAIRLLPNSTAYRQNLEKARGLKESSVKKK